MHLDLTLTFWGTLAAVFVIVELMTTALVSIWFVVGAVAAFIAACFDTSLLLQCYIFIGVLAVAFLLTRPFVRRVHPPVTPTNSDMLVGQTGLVTTDIDPSKSIGRVKIQNLSWQAASSDGSVVPAGTTVKVDRISGVTLYVSRLDSAN